MKVNIKAWSKSKQNRKIKIEIENHDTWSLDHTLAKIIYPALLQLKSEMHGVPSEFGDVGGASYENQQSFDFYTETHDEAWNKGITRWNDILDKMIWSFQQLSEDNYDSMYHHGNADYDWVKTDKLYPNITTGKMEPTYQMVDKNPNDHWYDFVGHQLHEERIQEGLELFGKYYRSLWD